MDREQINQHCATLPGADWSDPWGGGHDCWKVGGKMFAVTGAVNEGISFKCADEDSARMLMEAGRAEKAPYLPRGGWVFVRWGGMEQDELRERLTVSYLTVRRKLTKRAQAALGPEPVV